ncbi:MAG: hypothetical protein HGA86_06905 [Anaerolineaceae bacterium]|nr:hypothetical protein [Anaerolineaceae bacterium]
MVTSMERLKVLTMIQEGKITAEEGIRLLDTLEPAKPAVGNEQPSIPLNRSPRWFRVQVTDTDTGKTRVNIRLPVNVLNAGMKMGARFSPEVDGLDMNVITDSIRSGTIGKILDVFDDKDGEHVEVYLE